MGMFASFDMLVGRLLAWLYDRVEVRVTAILDAFFSYG